MRGPILLSVLLAGCSGDLVDERFHVIHDDAAIPVRVAGNVGRGTLILWESGGPSGPGIAEHLVDYIDTDELLEPHVAVASYDRRGVGNAHGDYTVEDLTLDALLGDLDAVRRVLVERYGFAHVVLLGHSWGAFSSGSYLLEHPGQVDGWIPVAGAFLGGPDENYVPYRHAWVCRVATDKVDEGASEALWAEAVAWCAAHPEPQPPDTEARLEMWGYYNEFGDRLEPWPSIETGPLLGALVASHVNLLDTQLGRNVISSPLHREIENVSLLPRLEAVEVPTLVVTGEYDGGLPTELGLEALEALGTPESDKRLVEIQGGGHYPFDSAPEVFTDEVLELVERVEAQ